MCPNLQSLSVISVDSWTFILHLQAFCLLKRPLSTGSAVPLSCIRRFEIFGLGCSQGYSWCGCVTGPVCPECRALQSK